MVEPGCPWPSCPNFGEEGSSKLQLAQRLLEWARQQGFHPEGVLFDAWYAAKGVLNQLQAYGWSFVTRLRSNRLLEGTPLKRHRGAYWVKVGRLRGLDFAVQGVRRGGKFYASSQRDWEGIEEIFWGLKQELGWVGPLVHGRKPVPKGIVHRHRKRVRLLVHLALGLVAYGLIELLLSPNEVRGVAAGAVQVEFLSVSAKTDGREANPGSEPFASGVVATA